MNLQFILFLEFGISLGANEHFVVIEAHLLSTERNVKAAMRLMDFARCETAIVVATADVQGLAIASASTDNGAAGHIAKGVGHPAIAVAGEQLKVVFHVLLSAVWHIGAALVWYHLGGQQIALVVGAAHIDGIAIDVVAGHNGAGHNIAARRTDPGLGLDEHLVSLQPVLGAAVWNVQAAVGGMHLAGRQAALEVATTHVQWLAVRGLADAEGMGRHLTIAGWDPAVMVAR